MCKSGLMFHTVNLNHAYTIFLINTVQFEYLMLLMLIFDISFLPVDQCDKLSYIWLMLLKHNLDNLAKGENKMDGKRNEIFKEFSF